jgi:hypothetical protein
MSFGWKFSHKNLKAKLWFFRKARPSRLKRLFYNKICLYIYRKNSETILKDCLKKSVRIVTSGWVVIVSSCMTDP